MKNRLLFLIALVAVICLCSYLLADWYSAKPLNIARSYVGRDSCVKCHQPEFELYHGSHHDRAMDVATDETVLADFNDQTIEHYGIESSMFRDGKKFMVRTDGPDGSLADFEVKYVFGVEPLQQYMVELSRPSDAKANEIGRVQVLRISWDTTKKKWFYLMPPDVDELLEPSDPLHWTGITQNWNASCAACHSTNLQKNYDHLAQQYHTTFSEIDVSCEACHGPASLHVELASAASPFWDRNHEYGLVKLKSESNLPQIETCAPCHSRRTMISEGFQPGCNFDDFFATQLLTDRIYHGDGQIRDEDYVYGSFIQSKMFHNAIRCTDCHDPHSTKVKFTDNNLCTSCHQHPAGKYDTPAHHHHTPGTPGASCVECHMPATTYMAVDSRRDHSLRVPRPDLSVRVGTPNACTQCHLTDPRGSAVSLTDFLPVELSEAPEVSASEKKLEQYLNWIEAAESGDEEVQAALKRVDLAMLNAVEKWYPRDQSEPLTKYYEQLAIGRSDAADRLPTLMSLAQDQKAPAMFRASALAVLTNDSSADSLETAMGSLSDSSPKVIAAALARIDVELGRISERQRYGQGPSANENELERLTKAIAELLQHDSKRVRMEAARVFATLPRQAQQKYAQQDQRRAYELALDEFKQSLYLEGDRASYQMMLGGLHEMLGDALRAKGDYRAAIAVEPNLAGPRSNLAALLEAEAMTLRERLQQSQQQGGIEAGQLRRSIEQIQKLGQQVQQLRAEEHQLLAKDIERSEGLAGTHGLHYRFAMSSYVQQDLAATEKHLLIAYHQQPTEPMYLMGLATYYFHVEQPESARSYVEALIKLDPDHPGYQALLKQLPSTHP